jgi:hypothetical protein
MIFPQEIDRNESKGEIIVFNKFKNEPNNFIILHSVFLHNHIKNLSGEIDFLVLVPNKGIFCLEVKHGRVRRENGSWVYKNTISNKSPFRQATDGMHSLRNWLLEQSSGESKKRLEKILFGTGVIFSGITTAIALGTEGEQWQVLYRDALINNHISNYINELSNKWHYKHENQYWYDNNLSRPTRDDCEQILKMLRNDFNRDYTTLNNILDTETTIESFTEEQLKILDLTRYNDRCLIEGFAGTGKTILALELFKTNIEKGLKVGFFCYNKGLAQSLEAKIKKFYSSIDLNGSFVGSFHSYLMQKSHLSMPNQNKEEFFNYKLPVEFLLTAEEESLEKFDIIIMDEAQDLITDNNLMIFAQILENGLKEGKWVLFGDFYYQNLYNNTIDYLALLKNYSQFTRLSPLTINCRNTTRISKQNNLLTGVKYNYKDSFQIDGTKPDLKFCNSSEEGAIVTDIIKGYLLDKVPLSQIILLSPLQLEKSSIYCSKYLSDLIKNKNLEYSTIHSYKGLEKNIVVVFGINELSDEKSLSLLYTGISRAKARLHLLINDSLQEKYRALITKNLV